jgi:hypothetical protein
LSEAEVAASGVEAVQPAEQVEAGVALAGPGIAALEHDRQNPGRPRAVVHNEADHAELLCHPVSCVLT